MDARAAEREKVAVIGHGCWESPITPDRIFFVESAVSEEFRLFLLCLEEALILAMDAEWKPVCQGSGNGGYPRVSILQIACRLPSDSRIWKEWSCDASEVGAGRDDRVADRRTSSIDTSSGNHESNVVILAREARDLDFSNTNSCGIERSTISMSEWDGSNQENNTTNELIFLLDLLSLSASTFGSSLRKVLCSSSVLKLGFAFKQDLINLSASFPGPDTHGCFDQVEPYLDIGKLFLKLNDTGKSSKYKEKSEMSLTSISESVLGLPLNKDVQCSNWEQRPLTEEQFKYAANDAYCLVAMYDALCTKALEKMKEGWAIDGGRKLCSVSTGRAKGGEILRPVMSEFRDSSGINQVPSFVCQQKRESAKRKINGGRKLCLESTGRVGVAEILNPVISELRDSSGRKLCSVSTGRVGVAEILNPVISGLRDTSGRKLCSVSTGRVGEIFSPVISGLRDFSGIDEAPSTVWQHKRGSAITMLEVALKDSSSLSSGMQYSAEDTLSLGTCTTEMETLNFGMLIQRISEKLLVKKGEQKSSHVKRKPRSGRAHDVDAVAEEDINWVGPPPWDVEVGGDGFPRFLCDTMVEGLARQLRCVGIDAASPKSARSDPRELVEIAEKEGRIILTRDIKLLRRRLVPKYLAYRVKRQGKWDQLAEIIETFQLSITEENLLSRCTKCNGNFIPQPLTSKQAAAQAPWSQTLPACALSKVNEFWQCAKCGHLYWQGYQFQRAYQQFTAMCHNNKDITPLEEAEA